MRNILAHYGGVLALIIAVSFFIVQPIIHHMEMTTNGSGPVVVSKEPVATTVSQKAADTVARAATDPALAAALHNQALQLSFTEQAVAGALGRIDGLNSRLNGALATGLTHASPKQQVITTSTTASSRLVAPTPGPTDDQVERSLKNVLNDPNTKVKTDINTHVKVTWEDKPYSPIAALYSSDGSAGVAYAFKREKGFNLDALLTTTSGVNSGLEAGLGIERPFKGTMAGVGIGGLYNFGAKGWRVNVFIPIHN